MRRYPTSTIPGIEKLFRQYDHVRMGGGQSKLGLLTRIAVASESDLPFKLAWKRLKHMSEGHPFHDTVLVEDQYFEKHPSSNKDSVFEVSLYKCLDCGLHFTDEGLALRDSNDDKPREAYYHDATTTILLRD